MAVFSALRALTDLIAQPDQAFVILGSAHPSQPPVGWGHTGWLWIGCDPEASLILSGEEADAQTQFEAFCLQAPVVPDDAPAVFLTLGYDAARMLDPTMGFVSPFLSPRAVWPALQAVTFNTILGIHLKSGDLHVVRGDDDYWQRQWWRCLLYAAEAPTYPTLPDEPDQNGYAPNWPADGFNQAVGHAQQLIAQGEFYQANLSVAFEKPVALTSPMELFWHSQVQNPSPFSGVWQQSGQFMLCNSPERLVALQADGRLISRPIAGTRGRLNTDDAIAAHLKSNPKELAEHAMLVDLQRNDLGKVCTANSVQVTDWLSAEQYSHVTHLVSQVEGQLAAKTGFWSILQALFPGGTITGCPKHRCMQAINDLEPTARGWYTGSMGWLNPNSHTMDLNILIRCLWLEAVEGMTYNARIQTGAGIVADSVASHEYRECIRKAALWIGVLNTHDRTKRRSGVNPG
jgi:anthranilate/para-aminobenzoate synthase component I